jgi:hypothetical protein
MKVDKNTQHQERGKYARLCVEVDLSKPLLEMFSIKGRTYKVGYEGLHLLCLSSGKFGHYVEGCPTKIVAVGSNGGNNGENKMDEGQTGRGAVSAAGPWTVVSKPRRPRKQPKVQDENKEEPVYKGSRFSVLNTDKEQQQSEDITVNNGEKVVNNSVSVINKAIIVHDVNDVVIDQTKATDGEQNASKIRGLHQVNKRVKLILERMLKIIN